MNGNSEVPTNYPLHPPPNLNQPPPPQRPQMQYYQYHSNHGYHVPHHHGYSGDTQQPPPPTLQGFNSMYSSNPVGFCLFNLNTLFVVYFLFFCFINASFYLIPN